MDYSNPTSLFSCDYFSCRRPTLPASSIPIAVNIIKVEEVSSDSEASTGCVNSPNISETSVFPAKSEPKKQDFFLMAKSKQGSKKLQKTLTNGAPEDVHKIVSALASRADELMVDKYGNYMCQALFQACTSSQRLTILRSIQPALLKVARHPIGTHSLQRLASFATLPSEGLIYEAAFRSQVTTLAKHPYASHVLQVLANSLPNKSFLANEISKQARELSMDQLGLCVVKKCMFSREIVQALLPHCLELSQDIYGNYAIQELLDVWGNEFHMAVGYHLQPQIVRLATHKFGSNVVEKCFRFPLLASVLARILIDPDNLGVLLSNMYGCYVLKSVAEFVPSVIDLLRKRTRELSASMPAHKLKGRQEQIALILGGSR